MSDECKTFDVREIPIPDKVNEAIAYLKSNFTDKRQWDYLRVYIELFQLREES